MGFVSNKRISFKYKVGFHKGIPRIDSSNNKNQHPTLNLDVPLEPNSTLLYWFGLGLRETVAWYHKDPSVSYYTVWLSPQFQPSSSSTCGCPEMLRLCSCRNSERGQAASLTIRCAAPTPLASVALTGYWCKVLNWGHKKKSDVSMAQRRKKINLHS